MRACGSRRPWAANGPVLADTYQQLGVLRVDGDRPRVVAVAALVSGLPALATVLAEGGAATCGLVGPPGRARMPGQRVHVPLGAGPVILPALAAVGGAHQAAELDPDQQEVGLVGAGRDPAHVRRPRPRRKAPAWAARAGRAAPRAHARSPRDRRCRTAGSARYPHRPSRRRRSQPARRQRAPAAGNRPSSGRHRPCAARRLHVIRRTRCRHQPGRRRGTVRRFRARTARPSTRCRSPRDGRSRPLSPRTSAPPRQPRARVGV